MTKDDIKKALQCCSGIRIYCNDCPYDAIGNCSDTLCADALNLIIEQEKEIEQLKAENNTNIQYIRMMGIQSHIKTSNERVKQAQIDVLNKLKERIKTAIDTYFNLDGGGYYLAEDALDDIDELIEEVENEN